MTNASLPTVPPKPFSYYMGRLNLRDGGVTTKRMITNAVETHGKRWDHQFDTMKKAMGMQTPTPEHRRIMYNQRLTATIPFQLLDEMGQPLMQTVPLDPMTGQQPVDEQSQPMQEPVIEHRPVWAVLKATFPRDYLRQAKDAVKVGAQVPPEVAYDVQEDERGKAPVREAVGGY